MQVNIKTLIDDVQCYDTVRELRWPEGRECSFCDSKRVIKRGFDELRKLFACSKTLASKPPKVLRNRQKES